MTDSHPLDDDPGLTAGDLEVLQAASTGEVLARLTPCQAESLSRWATETKRGFDADVAGMTLEQAQFVRVIRCEQGYSWRAVAATCALEWGESWGSNQLAGMAICGRSAELLGGHFMDEEWN